MTPQHAPRVPPGARRFDDSGTGLVEFAMILPLFVLLTLGVVETGYLLLDQHVVTKVSREGSNLISRDTSLQDAATAMRHMATRPLDFNGSHSKLILSVIRRGATVGSANHNKDFLYQRHEIGGLARASQLTTRGAGAFSGAPDYTAMNPDTDVNLQLTNLPPTIILPIGGMLYVTEVYTTYAPLTPLMNFGITMPETLYSIAYF